MRRETFWIAASCILAALGLRPIISSGAPPASTEKVIYAFTGGSDGAVPMSDLTLDAAGNLYGTTSQGGSGTCYNTTCGTVFELERTEKGWKEVVLHSFTGGSDGWAPQTGVIFDHAGNLYGATGTVFKLSPASKGGWSFSVIYTFPADGSAGTGPTSDLVFDSHGNLFATSRLGGTGGNPSVCHQDGCGTAFELTPQADGSWTEATIHEFAGAPDGATPSSGLVFDSAGDVYGMTTYGGSGRCNLGDNQDFPLPGCGTVYKLTHNADDRWKETVISSLVRGGGLAVNPSSGLLLGGSDRLIGTSLAGGDGFGAVFALMGLQTNSWKQAALHRFYGNPDGNSPQGRLAMGSGGEVVGATSYGGAQGDYLKGGAVFEVKETADGWKERVLHSFAGGTVDGAIPKAGLAVDSRGHLYGTTSQGGGSGCGGPGCGTVYEITR